MAEPIYLTSAFAGTGGQIKLCAEDFLVEEIPLYQPSGSGEHLYLRLRKTGLSTPELLFQLARFFRVRERDLGYAGLKDARATTIQTISVPGKSPDDAASLDLPGITLLDATSHGNKLRLGHLAGNRFRVRIRGTVEGTERSATETLAVLQDLGVPNLFGEQRYGVLGNSALIGRALLRREYDRVIALVIGNPEQISNDRWREAAERFVRKDLRGAVDILPGRMRDERRMLQQLLAGRGAEQAVLALPHKRLRLYLSAVQSRLFDRLVTMRLQSLERLWPGDWAYKHANGACFKVEDAAAEQPRADAFEISPTGALVGHKVQLAAGQAGLLEESLLDKEGIQPADFKLGRGLTMTGERRPLRVPLHDVELRTTSDGLLLGFSLPRGSYATSVLREVMKNAGTNPGTGTEA
ncbi:tRNA pseudouridine(13) synthase TruD [Geothermobacter hydrogeniphilus]|uniref:tRNA pseudouridine synthase D n=1 Tax=Geothermobacter hydrogeniphilus TaxID=1969733 RepID=A0A2K2H5U6_9BACT|nr:tRNA pseudouridine(13) synthase TruD [Geothermobacter hydrogeniphilus]PNU18678.1 tRNA pseudouridine(13) synthase TruD [Geothermobacter hydrogeniphilus]